MQGGHVATRHQRVLDTLTARRKGDPGALACSYPDTGSLRILDPAAEPPPRPPAPQASSGTIVDGRQVFCAMLGERQPGLVGDPEPSLLGHFSGRGAVRAPYSAVCGRMPHA